MGVNCQKKKNETIIYRNRLLQGLACWLARLPSNSVFKGLQRLPERGGKQAQSKPKREAAEKDSLGGVPAASAQERLEHEPLQ